MTTKLKSGSNEKRRGPSSTNIPPERSDVQMLKLRAKDGTVFLVEMGPAKMSKIIRQMVEDLTADGTRPIDWNAYPIPLDNISAPILDKIIHWMEYHYKNDPPAPEKEENDLSPLSEDISEWDEEFVQVDQGTLFELILATNYLNLKGLRTVCCKTVANTLKKKSVEQIREMYNIKNDFTPEEEEELRRETEWCDNFK